MKQRVRNFLIAFDQFMWVIITFGTGMPDETISAAAWRMEKERKLFGKVARPIIDLLFFPLERDHCYMAYTSEVMHTQLPERYRKELKIDQIEEDNSNCHMEALTYIVRIYSDGKSFKNHDKYEAVCTLIVTGKTAEIKGLHGKLNRKALRSLATQLKTMGVKTLIADRNGKDITYNLEKVNPA